MTNNFKQQAAQQRAAVPQVDLESVKPVAVPEPVEVPKASAPDTNRSQSSPPKVTPPAPHPPLTIVDTNETPTNRGFSMYPSRHRQVAKDLAYIEDRNPWEIIEDALEEYVVRHYGKDYRRK
jgi:hypothetical protein